MKSQEWLHKFFAAGNKINLDKVLDYKYSEEVQKSLAPLIEPSWHGVMPMILPFSKDNELIFYGVDQNERSLREVQRIISVALGTADISPEVSVITNPTNEAEKVLLSVFPQGVIKFFVSHYDRQPSEIKDSKKRTFEALGTLINLYQRRPALTSQLKRPLGSILRDFYVSCHANDSVNAQRYYDELSASASLSQRNLKFLLLQLYAASKQWELISNFESLPEVMLGRIPVRIQRLLVRTIGHETLDSIEENNFPDSSLDKAKKYCSIFSTFLRRVPDFPLAKQFERDWKLWALASAAISKPQWHHLPDFIDGNWVARAKQWVGDKSELSVAELNYEVPVRILSIHDVAKVLQGTLEPGFDEDNIVEIVDLLTSMPDETRRELENHRVLFAQWQWLTETIKGEEKLGWNKWFQKLFEDNSEQNSVRLLFAEVEEFSEGWEKSSFDDNFIKSIIHIDLNADASGVFRNALPFLEKWISNNEINCSPELITAFIDILALDDANSDEDLRLANNLLDKMLASSFDRESYVSCLDAMGSLIDTLSPRAFDYALDTVEMLMESTCPDTEARSNFWQKVQTFALEKWRRFNSEQQSLTKLLAIELGGEGLDTIFPPSEESERSYEISGSNLENKLIGIYSLTEGAARRAKVILEEKINGLKVEINHDHEHTSALANLAKKADYFVFAWGSSKHQAYFAVKKYREYLIYPSGKGTSSIVHACLNINHK